MALGFALVKQDFEEVITTSNKHPVPFSDALLFLKGRSLLRGEFLPGIINLW